MKNIVIAGANQGIGYYMVRELLRKGYNVTVLDIEIDNLTKLDGNILPILCDVSDRECVRESVEKSVAHFGSVDCAIQNACMCTFDSMEMTADEVYHKVFEINYFGALNLTRDVLPYMKEKNSGKVIFTSSGVGGHGVYQHQPVCIYKRCHRISHKVLKNRVCRLQYQLSHFSSAAYKHTFSKPALTVQNRTVSKLSAFAML